MVSVADVLATLCGSPPSRPLRRCACAASSRSTSTRPARARRARRSVRSSRYAERRSCRGASSRYALSNVGRGTPRRSSDCGQRARTLARRWQPLIAAVRARVPPVVAWLGHRGLHGRDLLPDRAAQGYRRPGQAALAWLDDVHQHALLREGWQRRVGKLVRAAAPRVA